MVMRCTGPIYPGSELAEKLGFTTERFDGYLYLENKTVWVSLIHALTPGQGHTTEFLDGLEKSGFGVIFPVVLSRRFSAYLKNRGFKTRREIEPLYKQEVEIHYKEPRKHEEN